MIAGLAIAVGFALGYLGARRRARSGRTALPFDPRCLRRPKRLAL
jgi:hypothetical protein